MITAFAEASSPHISLAAEEIFSVFGIPITNSMLLGLFGYALTVTVLIFTARAIKNGSKNRFAMLIQWGYEALLGTVEQVMGDKKMARRLAPLAITLFFFILMNYYIGILPFVGPITWNGVPLFRGLAADLNVTFALAIISMVTAQIYAIRVHGAFGNAKRYLRNPIKDPTGAFEGILEFIAEFSRLTALSLRLFGNVFAGEVLLIMVGFMTGYAAAIALPLFLLFELFMGAIQAYVFFMLTVVFVSLGTMSHDNHSSDHSNEKASRKATPVGNS